MPSRYATLSEVASPTPALKTALVVFDWPELVRSMVTMRQSSETEATKAAAANAATPRVSELARPASRGTRSRPTQPGRGGSSTQSVVMAASRVGAFPPHPDRWPGPRLTGHPDPARQHPAGQRTGVAQDLADHVASRYAGDATTAVGRAAGLVEAADRGTQIGVAGRRAAVEELARAQLTVEDVAAHEPVLGLHPVR